MTTVRHISVIAVLALLLVAGAAGAIKLACGRRSGGPYPALGAECAPAQAAVLLGAGVYSGRRVSPVVYDRIIAAVELYRAGRGGKILVTGDHGTPYYDEVNTIHHWLRKKGVPERDIFTDYAGFSTYDSMVRAKEGFAVESPYSLRRIPAAPARSTSRRRSDKAQASSPTAGIPTNLPLSGKGIPAA
jgi:SanA protein